MDYGRMTGRFTTVIRVDGTDTTVPLSGSLTITAATTHVLVNRQTVLPASVTCTLVNGYLHHDGHDYVDLVSTSSADANPLTFLYRITTNFDYLGKHVRYDPFYVALPPDSEIDLFDVAPAPNTAPNVIIRGPEGPPGADPNFDLWYDTGPGEVEPNLALMFANTQL